MQSLLFPVGEAGAEWLLIQPGAGPAGIGNAMVTRTDNSLMSYYNPAGLAFLTNSHVSFSRFEFLPGFYFDMFGYFSTFVVGRMDRPFLVRTVPGSTVLKLGALLHGR